MNQDVSGQVTDLNRINPVEVGGAEMSTVLKVLTLNMLI